MATAILQKAFAAAIGPVSLPGMLRRLTSAFLLSALPVCLPTTRIDEAAPEPVNVCYQGCPTGAPATNKTVDHKIFVLSNNGKTKFADWVAYVVTRDTIGQETRERNWRLDNDLLKTETLGPKDYEGLKNTAYDRGHQAPLSSLAGTSDWSEANELSNITPQKKALNEGPWKKLEYAERKLAKQGETVYSVTGPLYERVMPKLPHARVAHIVPSGYWKVLMIERDGEVQAAAFIMDQNLAANKNFCDQKVALMAVEARARLQLSPNMPALRKQQAEQNAPKLLKKLGCK